MDNTDFTCAGCKRALRDGEEIRLLDACEHFAHADCSLIKSGRCAFDDQLLDLPALAAAPTHTFTFDFGSRYDRLQYSNYRSESCRNIGWIFKHHRGRHETAFAWFEKATSKSRGNANALLDLADCYERGEGVERDLERAAELRKSAEPWVRKAKERNREFLVQLGEHPSDTDDDADAQLTLREGPTKDTDSSAQAASEAAQPTETPQAPLVSTPLFQTIREEADAGGEVDAPAETGFENSPPGQPPPEGTELAEATEGESSTLLFEGTGLETGAVDDTDFRADSSLEYHSSGQTSTENAACEQVPTVGNVLPAACGFEARYEETDAVRDIDSRVDTGLESVRTGQAASQKAEPISDAEDVLRAFPLPKTSLQGSAGVPELDAQAEVGFEHRSPGLVDVKQGVEQATASEGVVSGLPSSGATVHRTESAGGNDGRVEMGRDHTLSGQGASGNGTSEQTATAQTALHAAVPQETFLQETQITQEVYATAGVDIEYATSSQATSEHAASECAPTAEDVLPSPSRPGTIYERTEDFSKIDIPPVADLKYASSGKGASEKRASRQPSAVQSAVPSPARRKTSRRETKAARKTGAQTGELGDLNAPTVSGARLRLFTNVLETPFVRNPIRRRILNNSGFAAFRDRASRSDDSNVHPRDLPIHYPLPPKAPPPHLVHIDALFHALGTKTAAGKRARPTIRDYNAAFKVGKKTPLQVTEALLRMVEESNVASVGINAVIHTKPAYSFAQAAASTVRWAKGAPLSVLDGVPYTVKDSLDVAGFATRCASGCLGDEADKLQQADSDVVQALNGAGMVMIGKCNQDELDIGVRGFSKFTGQTRNPHNTGYVPGGASGGCAAAVAAGLCPVSIGSESGGGIRIPAACCGVLGLKASFARISTFGKVLTKRNVDKDPVSPLLHVGPITGCAEDLALMYYMLAGFAPHRPIPSLPSYYGPTEFVPPTIHPELEGLRVGVCSPWLQSVHKSPQGFSATNDALDRMFFHGAVPVSVDIPDVDLEDLRVALSITVVTQLLSSLRNACHSTERKSSSFGLDTRNKLAVGELFTEGDLARSNTVRARAMDYCVQELFGRNNLDVIVTPALGAEIPRVPRNLETGFLDVNTDSKLMRFSVFAVYTGIPACVIPVKRNLDNGLPCAIQVM